MKLLRRVFLLGPVVVVVALSGPGSLHAQEQHLSAPWMDAKLDAQVRTRALLRAMTRDDKLGLVFGYYANDARWKSYRKPAGALDQAAGFIPGIPRLGIPALQETDAGIGVASQAGPHPRSRTALPSNIAVAATWDPQLAFSGGQMIGNEARLSGFNVIWPGESTCCASLAMVATLNTRVRIRGWRAAWSRRRFGAFSPITSSRP